MPFDASALAEHAWKEADYIVVMSFRGALAILVWSPPLRMERKGLEQCV